MLRRLRDAPESADDRTPVASELLDGLRRRRPAAFRTAHHPAEIRLRTSSAATLHCTASRSPRNSHGKRLLRRRCDRKRA